MERLGNATRDVPILRSPQSVSSACDDQLRIGGRLQRTAFPIVEQHRPEYLGSEMPELSHAAPHEPRRAFLLSLDSSQFANFIRSTEQAVFPGEKHVAGSSLYSTSGGYQYFAPSHYAKGGLISPALVADLQDGAQLLSLGCGPAHMERSLVTLFGINPAAIDLCDRKTYPQIAQWNFRFRQFDLLAAWPAFDKQYDYVVFPESFGCATLDGNRGRSERFCEELAAVEDAVLSGRLFSVPPSELQFFKHVVAADFPEVTSAIVKTLLSAYALLKPGGEVRVQGHCLNSQELAYTVSELVEREPSIAVLEHSSRMLLLKKNG